MTTTRSDTTPTGRLVEPGNRKRLEKITRLSREAIRGDFFYQGLVFVGALTYVALAIWAARSASS